MYLHISEISLRKALENSDAQTHYFSEHQATNYGDSLTSHVVFVPGTELSYVT